MSVYIKGMEMPKGCFFCICNKHLDPDTDMCILTRDAFDSTFRTVQHRRDNCPLVPVPEHGRLVDGDALIDELPNNLGIRGLEYLNRQESAIVSWIHAAPTIIPADKEGE